MTASKTRALLGVGVVAILTTVAGAARAGTITKETINGRTVRIFAPSSPGAKAPLLVMLHGCTQTADAFADATRAEALAEAEGFFVAFPEQPDSAGSNRCWQWYDTAHQKRDAGEPKELADVIAELVSSRGLDGDRVYVAGLSAGAAMSVVLGATYPDRVTAIGVVAGLEYGAASSIAGVYAASTSGGPDPQAQGDVVFGVMGSRARVLPVFVVQGTADAIVSKVNGEQVAAQWRRTNERVLGDGAIAAPVSTTGQAGYTFTRTLHRTKSNETVVEHYAVDDLGHAWPGGKTGGSFSDAKGPDATKLLWAFFSPRTKSAPLVVDPDPSAPSSEESPSPLPGTTGPDSPADGAPGGSSSDGGGCAESPSRSRGGDVVLGLALASAIVLARRRRA